MYVNSRLKALATWGLLIITLAGFGPAAFGDLGTQPGLIIGTDGRQTISQYASAHSLSSAQIRHEFSASGRLTCMVDGHPKTATAQVTVRGDIVTTVAHALFPSCNQGVDVTSCTFSTDFLDEGGSVRSYRVAELVALGDSCPAQNEAEDWAVLRLEKVVAGASAYPVVAIENPQAFAGAPITNPAGVHMDRCVPGDCQVLIADCSVRDVLAGPYFHMDCSMGIGASGSALLAQLDDGRMGMIAMQIDKAHLAQPSYSDYSRDSVFTESIPMQGRFLQTLLGLK